MATARADRRLAAVLVADVAGYSRLVERDERGIVARLRDHRTELVMPLLAEHHGRIVKLTGDGAVCEFGSAVDAVECAACIQRGMAEREGSLPEAERIGFRIGINLGDLIHDEGDLYGDGVNIAARLEGIADPGGICVSRTVYEYVRGKVQLGFRALGPQRLKNLSEPVEAYQVVLAGGLLHVGRRPRRRHLLVVGTSVLLALFALASGGWWFLVRPARDETIPAGGKPTLAVLAFDNLSGDPAQDYFSDGIAEAILTALARSSHLSVTARNSSFVYKGGPADVKQVGRELGVRYLLEGSVQKAGDRVRVTAQLVDTHTGGHVWAERYDRPLGDIFAVQDEVTAAIAARLGASIERAEADLAKRKAPADLGAYDYYLQGRAKRLTSVKAQILEARELFKKAVELDPGFAPAYAELAHSYYTEVALRWDVPRRAEALAEGFAAARTAIALDPTLALAHLSMGNLSLRQHNYDEAVAWAERAMAFDPSDPENYAGLANIYSFIGRSADAVMLMRKAIELDPIYPPRYAMYLGRAYLLSRQPEAAAPYLRDAASRAPDYWPSSFYLAAACGQLGKSDEARAALAAARQYVEVVSVADFAMANDYRSGPEQDFLFEGLALAGLPRESTPRPE